MYFEKKNYVFWQQKGEIRCETKYSEYASINAFRQRHVPGASQSRARRKLCYHPKYHLLFALVFLKTILKMEATQIFMRFWNIHIIKDMHVTIENVTFP